MSRQFDLRDPNFDPVEFSDYLREHRDEFKSTDPRFGPEWEAEFGEEAWAVALELFG